MMKLQTTVNYSDSYTYCLIGISCMRKSKTYFLVFSEGENFQAISWVLFCKNDAGSLTFNVQQIRINFTASQGVQRMQLILYSVCEISCDFLQPSTKSFVAMCYHIGCSDSFPLDNELGFKKYTKQSFPVSGNVFKNVIHEIQENLM